MKDQINTIREALALMPATHTTDKALTALSELEAMAGEQEPVAWRTFDGEGGYDYRTYDENEDYADEWDKRNPNHKGWVEPLYAAPVAQQPRLQVGDSQFESWYNEGFDPKNKGLKQHMREAYEAGMNDPVAKQPQAEACYCDANNLGVPGVSCGDCTRDYKQRAEPKRVEALMKRAEAAPSFKEAPASVMESRGYVWVEPSERTGWGGGWTLPTPQQAEAVPSDVLGSEWAPCIKRPVVVHVREQRPRERHVSTREGLTPVKPDDLIMRGVSGEEYPIGRAIFEQTYDLVAATLAAAPKGQP